MDLARSMFGDRRQVLGRSVSHMSFEPVDRVPACHLDHEAIARALRQDRGGGDACVPGVALDDRLGGAMKAVRNSIAVDRRLAGLDRQTLDRLAHRQHGGLEDVGPVDLHVVDKGDAPYSFGANARLSGFSLGEAERFRIRYAVEVELLRKHDGGRDDGTGQWASPNLVDPGDSRASRTSQRLPGSNGHRPEDGRPGPLGRGCAYLATECGKLARTHGARR